MDTGDTGLCTQVGETMALNSAYALEIKCHQVWVQQLEKPVHVCA